MITVQSIITFAGVEVKYTLPSAMGWIAFRASGGNILMKSTSGSATDYWTILADTGEVIQDTSMAGGTLYFIAAAGVILESKYSSRLQS